MAPALPAPCAPRAGTLIAQAERRRATRRILRAICQYRLPGCWNDSGYDDSAEHRATEDIFCRPNRRRCRRHSPDRSERVAPRRPEYELARLRVQLGACNCWRDSAARVPRPDRSQGPLGLLPCDAHRHGDPRSLGAGILAPQRSFHSDRWHAYLSQVGRHPQLRFLLHSAVLPSAYRGRSVAADPEATDLGEGARRGGWDRCAVCTLRVSRALRLTSTT